MKLDLKQNEIDTIKAALNCALFFGENYFTFAPFSPDDYNQGYEKLDEERTYIAQDLLIKLEG